MADVKGLEAKIASLEKEKRQKNFQFTALEALLKKTKAELDKLKDAAASPADAAPEGSSDTDQRLEQAAAALHRCEGELQVARSQAEAFKADMNVAKGEAAAAKSEVEAADGARVEAVESSKVARQELEAANKFSDKLQAELDGAREEAEGLKGALCEAQKQLEDARSAREEEGALLRAQEKIVELETLLSGSDETAVELQCLKKAVSSMEEEKSRMVLEVEELRKAYGELEEQKRQLDEASCKAKEGLQATDALEKELDSTRNAYEAIVEDLKISLAKGKSCSDLLQQQLDQANSRAQGESARLQEGEAAFLEIQKALEQATGQISKLEETAANETTRAQREHELRLATDAKMSSFEPEMDRLRAQVEQLGNELDNHARNSEEQVNAAKEKMLRMEAAADAHEAKSNRLSQEAQEARERMIELQSACSDLEARLEEANKSSSTPASSFEDKEDFRSQAKAAQDEALRLMTLAEEKEAECNEMQTLMQAKETEADELALRCHQLLGENKKLLQRIAEADTRLLYAAELALSNPTSLNNSKNSAGSPLNTAEDGERQAKEEEEADVPEMEGREGAESVEAQVALEFRSSDAESSILTDDAPARKASSVAAAEQSAGDQAAEPLKATRKTLRPLPAKQLPSDSAPVSAKRQSGELAGPFVNDALDKENASNVFPVPAPTKKARKLFNPVQLPEDLTGDPFASS